MISVSNRFLSALLVCVLLAHSSWSSNNVCTSRECKILSGRIYRMMDTSVDPCDNFEQFTCGGYRQYRFSSDGEPISFAKDLGVQFQDMAKEMLNSSTPIGAKSQRVEDLYALLKLIYNKCNHSFGKDAKKEHLEYIIFQEIDRYGANIDPSESLGKFLGKLLNKLASVSMTTTQNQYMFVKRDRSGELVVEIDLPLFFGDLTTIRSFAQSLSRRGLLQNLSNKSLDFMNAIDTTDWHITRSCQFKSSDLARGFLFDFSEFNKYFKFLNNATKLENVSIILHKCMSTIKLINRYGSQESFKSYLAIKLLFYTFKNILTEHNSKDFCLNELAQKFPMLLSDMFRQKYICFDDIKETKTIIAKLKNAAVKLARKQTWLDKTSLENYIKRVEQLSATYGYPRNLTEAVVQKLSRSSTLRLSKFGKSSDKDFLKNLLDFQDAYSSAVLSQVKTKQSLLKLFEMNLLLLGNGYAFFHAMNFQETSLLFSLSTEFPFLLSATLPDYLKLSGYGFIAAHEIEHILKYPNPHNLHFTKETLDKYRKRVECIRSVYQEEYAKVLSVSNETALAFSSETINENIADFTADSVFYEAAFGEGRRSLKQKMRMPGPLSAYTPEQVFFIHRLQIFCSKFFESEYKKHGPDYFLHSPPSMRVNVTSKNSRHLAEAFKCKPGTPMNPIREKCVLL